MRELNISSAHFPYPLSHGEVTLWGDGLKERIHIYLYLHSFSPPIQSSFLPSLVSSLLSAFRRNANRYSWTKGTESCYLRPGSICIFLKKKQMAQRCMRFFDSCGLGLNLNSEVNQTTYFRVRGKHENNTCTITIWQLQLGKKDQKQVVINVCNTEMEDPQAPLMPEYSLQWNLLSGEHFLVKNDAANGILISTTRQNLKTLPVSETFLRDGTFKSFPPFEKLLVLFRSEDFSVTLILWITERKIIFCSPTVFSKKYLKNWKHRSQEKHHTIIYYTFGGKTD